METREMNSQPEKSNSQILMKLKNLNKLDYLKNK